MCHYISASCYENIRDLEIGQFVLPNPISSSTVFTLGLGIFALARAYRMYDAPERRRAPPIPAADALNTVLSQKLSFPLLLLPPSTIDVTEERVLEDSTICSPLPGSIGSNTNKREESAVGVIVGAALMPLISANVEEKEYENEVESAFGLFTSGISI